MTPDPSQRPEDRPHHPPRPEPDVTSQRLADRWDADTVRHVLTGAVLGLLALPALASALVGLLVLAVQGTPLWLLVTAAALVTAALAGGGAAVALRRGHRGVVHRLAVLAGVWGVATTLGAVVLALASDAPDRVGVAVLLVLGGTYTLVAALALAGAWRVLPAPGDAPAAEVADGHLDDEGAALEPEPALPVRTGATPTVSEVPTPAVPPDDDSLADWPAWGGAPAAPTTAPGDAAEASEADDAVDATRVDLPRAEVAEGSYVGPPYVRPPYAAPADDASADDASGGSARGGRTSATRPPAPRSTSAARTSSSAPRTSSGSASAGASAPRTSSRPSTPRTSASTSRTSGTTSRANGTTSRAGGPRPPRRSVSSSTPRVSRGATPGQATERIARADGDDGPPTERLPPLDL